MPPQREEQPNHEEMPTESSEEEPTTSDYSSEEDALPTKQKPKLDLENDDIEGASAPPPSTVLTSPPQPEDAVGGPNPKREEEMAAMQPRNDAKAVAAPEVRLIRQPGDPTPKRKVQPPQVSRRQSDLVLSTAGVGSVGGRVALEVLPTEPVQPPQVRYLVGSLTWRSQVNCRGGICGR